MGGPNKTSSEAVKYSKHGRHIPWARFGFEGVLIVASILAAFSIDAWWERQEKDRQQLKLVSELKVDFEATRKRLAESLAFADSINDRASQFLAMVASDEPAELPDLRNQIGGAFLKIDFAPVLSAYESAVATGKIGLIENTALLESLTEFHQAWDYYKLHDRIAAEIFYVGPIWELRRELGSLRMLFRNPDTHPDRFRRTDEEYRKFFTRPVVYAAVETMLTAQRNSAGGLRRMDEAAEDVLEILEQLQ